VNASEKARLTQLIHESSQEMIHDAVFPVVDAARVLVMNAKGNEVRQADLDELRSALRNAQRTALVAVDQLATRIEATTTTADQKTIGKMFADALREAVDGVQP